MDVPLYIWWYVLFWSVPCFVLIKPGQLSHGWCLHGTCFSIWVRGHREYLQVLWFLRRLIELRKAVIFTGMVYSRESMQIKTGARRRCIQWSTVEDKCKGLVVLSVELPWQCLILSSMMRDNKNEVLPARAAHLGLDIQGFYWGRQSWRDGALLWLTSTNQSPALLSLAELTVIRCGPGYQENKNRHLP